MNIRKLLEQAEKQNLHGFRELIDEIGLTDEFFREGEEIASLYPRAFSSMQEHMLKSAIEVATTMNEFGSLTEMMPQSLKHFALKHMEISLKAIFNLWSKTKEAITAEDIEKANEKRVN